MPPDTRPPPRRARYPDRAPGQGRDGTVGRHRDAARGVLPDDALVLDEPAVSPGPRPRARDRGDVRDQAAAGRVRRHVGAPGRPACELRWMRCETNGSDSLEAHVASPCLPCLSPPHGSAISWPSKQRLRAGPNSVPTWCRCAASALPDRSSQGTAAASSAVSREAMLVPHPAAGAIGDRTVCTPGAAVIQMRPPVEQLLPARVGADRLPRRLAAWRGHRPVQRLAAMAVAVHPGPLRPPRLDRAERHSAHARCHMASAWAASAG